MLGFKSFKTAIFILSGIEAKHMMRNVHIDLQNQSVQNQKNFIHKVFGLIGVAPHRYQAKKIGHPQNEKTC